jgi:hypothetical protein
MNVYPSLPPCPIPVSPSVFAACASTFRFVPVPCFGHLSASAVVPILCTLVCMVFYLSLSLSLFVPFSLWCLYLFGCLRSLYASCWGCSFVSGLTAFGALICFTVIAPVCRGLTVGKLFTYILIVLLTKCKLCIFVAFLLK